MVSPVSAATHKTYKTYSRRDAIAMLGLIGQIARTAKFHKKAPYSLRTFLQHADVNHSQMNAIIAYAKTQVHVPATLLFWLYRSCKNLQISCDVELPHICKIASPTGEKFYVTDKTDWLAHRDATTDKKTIKIREHAKTQFLKRVIGIDVEFLLSHFPTAVLEMEGEALPSGGKAVTHKDHIYIIEDGECVSVLNKGMPLSKDK